MRLTLPDLRVVIGSVWGGGWFAPGLVALAAAWTTLIFAFVLTDFEGDVSLLVCAVQTAILLAVAGQLRTLGCLGVALGIEIVAILTGFSIVLGLLSLVLAAHNAPYIDPVLARIGSLFLGEAYWQTLLAVVQHHPTTMTYLSFVYDMLNPQPLLLIPALIHAGKASRLRVFGIAWMIALTTVVLISPFTPAIGTYLHFGIPRGSLSGVDLTVAWDHIGPLDTVRGGGLRLLGVDSLIGVVTFPSFHAAGAVLLGWTAWGCLWLRWPGLLLNGALYASAIFIGGHFVVDVVAGTAIAVAALGLAKTVEARASVPRRDPVPASVRPFPGPPRTAMDLPTTSFVESGVKAIKEISPWPIPARSKNI